VKTHLQNLGKLLKSSRWFDPTYAIINLAMRNVQSVWEDLSSCAISIEGPKTVTEFMAKKAVEKVQLERRRKDIEKKNPS